MEKEEEVDRRRGKKSISKRGKGWTLSAQLEQLKTGQDRKGLLRSHLWCPNDHARFRDKLDYTRLDIIFDIYKRDIAHWHAKNNTTMQSV